MTDNYYIRIMKWALALSGGGARGLAHIGVIQALEEMRVPPPALVVGCSMGAIIGGLYANGMKSAEMRQFFDASFTATDYLCNTPLTKHRGAVSNLFRIRKGISNLMTADGMDSGERLHELLLELTNNATFGHTPIPFYCNATDLCTGTEIVLETGPIADAMRSSSSFPGVFSPFAKEGRLLADGYLKHNTPVWIARERGISNVLAVYLNRFGTIRNDSLKTSIDVLMRSFDCAVHQPKTENRDIPTAHLLADSDRAVFDFNKPEIQIDFGYEAAMAQKMTIDTFFAKGIPGMMGRNRLAGKERKGALT